MAGPDKKSQDARNRSGGGLYWKDVLSNVAGVLLVGGALMYGYLSICYDRFYGSLGVDPNDVGLSYTGTLARSSGFVVVYLLVVFWIGSGLADLISQWRARRHRVEAAVLFLLLGAMLLGVMLFLPWVARQSAEVVMRGEGVAPVPQPFTTVVPPVLAIHADPATVEPAGKPEDAPGAKRLRGRKLLYLGQANGTVVLYDSDAGEAIHVAASSIVLHVTNCDVRPVPPSCPRPLELAPI